ncbi:MAG: hypothetical protein KatS3mg085_089 [Candidatus Dojkabacteria bacterium]|nr:MAG: hypothetical protein KatS3mg085_089 [Candidatus Dojkabacteria bacterium]
MNYKKFLEKVIQKNLIKRNAQGEEAATEILVDFLKEFNPVIQQFKNSVPVYKDYGLEIDGQKIEAEPICFESGEQNDFTLSTFEEDLDFERNYIATNPHCSAISKHTFTKGLLHGRSSQVFLNSSKTKKSRNIKSYIEVEKYNYTTANVLVGNFQNPEFIVYSHLDTVENGVVDNLSGTLVMLNLLSKNSLILENSLFVFSGNEELSYDFPTYWGYGYRQFEKEYSTIFNKAKHLIVDCIAFGELKVYNDVETLMLGFPIKDQSVFSQTRMFSCDLNKLMTIYHSKLDDINFFSEKDIEETTFKIFNLINNEK